MTRIRRALSVGFWSAVQSWRAWPQPLHVHVIGAAQCDANPACRSGGSTV